MNRNHDSKFSVFGENVTVTRRDIRREQRWDLSPADYSQPRRLADILTLAYSYGVEDALSNAQNGISTAINDEIKKQCVFTNKGEPVADE